MVLLDGTAVNYFHKKDSITRDEYLSLLFCHKPSYIKACFCKSQTPTPSLCQLTLLGNYQSILYAHDSVSVSQTGSDVSDFRFHIVSYILDESKFQVVFLNSTLSLWQYCQRQSTGFKRCVQLFNYPPPIKIFMQLSLMQYGL